jgi:hypothetical protein
MMISGSACKLTNTNNWYRALPWSATSEPPARLHLEHLRHSGTARDVLHAGRRSRENRSCLSKRCAVCIALKTRGQPALRLFQPREIFVHLSLIATIGQRRLTERMNKASS